MSKFTPAPWSWVIEADGRLMITHNGEYLPPTLDNANLIVAAPEMYEALSNTVYLLEDFGCHEATIIKKLLASIDGTEAQS